MKLPVIALFAALAGALPACGVDVPRATPLDAQRAAQKHPGTTVADLDRGRSMYLSKCTSCHRPVAPRSIQSAHWPEHVGEMSERAHLTSEDRDAILLYLMTIAEAPQP